MRNYLKHSQLYEIENDIKDIVTTIEKKHSQQDLILSSLIYHYTQSYIFGKTFIGSNLNKNDNGYFVRLISNDEVESNDPLIDPNKFLAANYHLVNLKDEKYEEGFDIYYKPRYSSSENEGMVYIKDLLKDFPQAIIPSSAYPEFADYKGEIDNYDGRRKIKHPLIEDCAKAVPLTIEEIKNHKFGSLILSKLEEQSKYKIIFEQSDERREVNLENKKAHRIVSYTFGERAAEDLNRLSNINIEEHDECYYSIFKKLQKEGLAYIESLRSTNSSCPNKAIISTNNFGITGILIYREQFYQAGDELKDKLTAISSIAIAKESRGQGLAVKLFEKAAETALENKQILFRTTPSQNGRSYLEKSIDKVIKDNNYYHIISSDDQEQYLFEQISKISYGIIKQIHHQGKIYAHQPIDSPYKVITEFVKKYRDMVDQSPMQENYGDMVRKRKIIDILFDDFVNSIKKKEIKNKKSYKL